MGKKSWNIVQWFAISGIVVAIYLLWEQVTRSPFQPCNINSVINCNAIISGSVAKIAGIPTPMIGLVGYLIILFSTIFRKRKLLLGMSSFGLVFCLWIAYQEIFLLHVLCPACLLCQGIMLTIFIFSINLNLGKEGKHEK